MPEFDSILAPAIEIEPQPVRLALPRFDAALKVSSSIRSPGDKDEVVRAVRSIANEWSVSEPMVAYRLHPIRQVSPAIYRAATSEYAARWNAQKQREKRQGERDGKAARPTTQSANTSSGTLIDVVRRTLRDNALTHTKAAKVLGVKPGLVEPLAPPRAAHRAS